MELVIPSSEEMKRSREPVNELSDEQVRYVEGKFDKALKTPAITSITFSYGCFNGNQLRNLARKIAEKGYEVKNVMSNNKIFTIVVLIVKDE